MAVNRRQFLQILSASTAGAFTLDPERLLWVPGEKTIFIPPARKLIYAGEMSSAELRHARELESMSPIFGVHNPRYEVVVGKEYKHVTGRYTTVFIYENYMPGEYNVQKNR